MKVLILKYVSKEQLCEGHKSLRDTPQSLEGAHHPYWTLRGCNVGLIWLQWSCDQYFYHKNGITLQSRGVSLDSLIYVKRMLLSWGLLWTEVLVKLGRLELVMSHPGLSRLAASSSHLSVPPRRRLSNSELRQGANEDILQPNSPNWWHAGMESGGTHSAPLLLASAALWSVPLELEHTQTGPGG